MIPALDVTCQIRYCNPIMTGTDFAEAPVRLLDEPSRAAIEIAVAQWVGSERCTSAARERLRELRVDAFEIERNRRADSRNPELRGLLRFAVTTLIARGRVVESDLRRLRPRPSDALLAEVASITARAFLRITLVESLGLERHVPPLAMAIGDY
jgi:alkylhydroperoxidase family enzyme